MRLIDADVLIEILTTAIRNMQGIAKFIGAEDDPQIKMEIKAYRDILNGVKEQPTIEPERKAEWIPCSERLPDMWDEIYLVSLAWGGVGTMEFKDTGWHNYGSLSPVPIETVTAWMPLPEPYKEENDG